MEPEILKKQLNFQTVRAPRSSAGLQARLIRFTIGERRFGIVASAVMEVTAPLEVTSIPFGSDFLSGIAPLRGEIVAVIDFAAAVGDIASASASKAKYIILHPMQLEESLPIAFAVDRVDDVTFIQAIDVDAADENASPCIVGRVNSDSPPTEIVDHRKLPQILSHAQ